MVRCRSRPCRPLAAAILRRVLRHRRLRPLGKARLARLGAAIGMRTIAEREMQPASRIGTRGSLGGRPVRCRHMRGWRISRTRSGRWRTRREWICHLRHALANDGTGTDKPVAIARAYLEPAVADCRGLRCGRVRMDRRCFGRSCRQRRRRGFQWRRRRIAIARAIGAGFDQLRLACRGGPRRLAAGLTRPAPTDNIADCRR